MIRIQQVKLPIDHKNNDLINKITKILRVNKQQVVDYTIYRKSLDARKKSELFFNYTLDVEVKDESKVLKRNKNKNVSAVQKYDYEIKNTGDKILEHRTVIVGSGPAGLFCGLILAELGFRPIIIERGQDVDSRIAHIETFWQEGKLDKESNVQFGEGGAGTFSDGKLNTLVKDKNRRGRKVLTEFVDAGAPDEILYSNKPHIGTDILRTVIKNIRKKIITLGGEFRFGTKLTSIVTEDSTLKSIEVNHDEVIDTELLVLAIGHSARDTFEMLYDNNMTIEQKAFSVGVRVEHPQVLINKSQYGDYFDHERLGAADYKLKYHTSNGRGVYTFCMCPGGVVVAASSEENKVVTNGMSYYKRDKDNANSALLVSVTPDDFGSDHPLAGVEYQRRWEQKAFELGGSNYNAPVQLVGDFLEDRLTGEIGEVIPSYSNYTFAKISECLPDYVVQSLKEGILAFDKRVKGFAMNDAVLTGVETRSSSPIRMLRDDNFESNIKGLYPAGEGAGYAGGIMSAAMDGIKIAEQIARNYRCE